MNPARPSAFSDLPATTLDEQALGRLRELDPDGQHGVVVRVLGAFETSLSRMLTQLQGQGDAPDPSAVSAIAHTLKSASASVGALSLSATCAGVEGRLRSGLTAGLREDVEQMLAQGQAALRAVGAMLRP